MHNLQDFAKFANFENLGFKYNFAKFLYGYSQSFDTANQRFSELAAAQEFFSDFISDLN